MLKKAVDGDSGAYKDFLKLASQVIRRIIGGKIFNEAEIDDVLQEVLISIHKARHTYDFNRRLMPWIYSIINFRVADHLRREYGEKIFEKVQIDDEALQIEDNSVTDSYTDNEYIEKAIKELKDKQQKVIRLMYFEDMSVKQVAEKLMISEADVKTSAHRAYKILRKVI